MNKRDPFRPLLGAGLFAFGYYILLNLVATVAQFLGRDMVAQTIPPLVAASLMGALKIESRGPQNHSFTQAEFDRRYRDNFG